MGKLAVYKYIGFMFLIVTVIMSAFTLFGLYGGDSDPTHNTISALLVYLLPVLIIGDAVLLLYWVVRRRWHWALIPFVTILVVLFSRQKSAAWLVSLEGAILAALCWLSIGSGYEKDMYELIRQDYLVRNERWNEIVERAQEYQVHTPFSSVCVNLALSQQRQLAERMFEFYQSGEDALIMPSIRDLTSMLPTSEVFWHLGMVNSAQRYVFDTQESILNGRKSGRCTKRIAECMIVNGHYGPARKQMNLLKKTLFYRHWAYETEQLLGNEQRVNAHPVYGLLRKLRFKENYLFSFAEIEKMVGLLFMNNQENRMALDYFIGQLLLKGDLQGFQQYMGWVQQYGGYRYMPVGYQDVMPELSESDCLELIFETIDKVKPGGKVIIPHNTYEYLSYKKEGAELLLTIKGLRIEEPAMGLKGYVIGSREM